MKLKGDWIRGPSRWKKAANIIRTVASCLLVSFLCTSVARASDGNTSINNLSHTFYKIINLAGYVTFINGYMDFTASLEGKDSSGLLVPARKMFAGAILCCTDYFLDSVGVWKAVNSGTTVSNIDGIITVISSIITLFASGMGLFSTINGIQKLATAYVAHDMSTMISYVKSVFAGVLMMFAGAVATYFNLKP